jgi:hypothetical protein
MFYYLDNKKLFQHAKEKGLYLNDLLDSEKSRILPRERHMIMYTAGFRTTRETVCCLTRVLGSELADLFRLGVVEKRDDPPRQLDSAFPEASW